MTFVHKILAPTDFSRESEHALDFAVELSTRFAVPLVVLHVYEIPVVMAAGALVPLPLPPEADIGAAVERELARVVARARALGARDVRQMTSGGAPWRDIVRTANDEGCDLIVIGAHGHGGFKHLLLGSVAEKVIRAAECPVLTVGPKVK